MLCALCHKIMTPLLWDSTRSQLGLPQVNKKAKVKRFTPTFCCGGAIARGARVVSVDVQPFGRASQSDKRQVEEGFKIHRTLSPCFVVENKTGNCPVIQPLLLTPLSSLQPLDASTRRPPLPRCVCCAAHASPRSTMNTTSIPTTILFTQFTKRDVILYALGIGCCSDTDDASKEANDEVERHRELKYVYEHHPDFQAFPTFLLTQSFQAEVVAAQSQSASETPSPQQHNYQQHKSRLGFGIRPFPPESLGDGSGGGMIIPIQFFKRQEDVDDAREMPVLHMSQTLVLREQFPNYQQSTSSIECDSPTQIHLQTRILAIKPRSIGVFVTSETTYYRTEEDGSRVCIATAQMVALVLGLDPEKVIQLKAPLSIVYSTPRMNAVASNTVERRANYRYRIPSNAALLYRLSGDYNPIHVGRSDEGMFGSNHNSPNENLTRGAVLHGLCTLGYAVRAVMKRVEEDHESK